MNRPISTGRLWPALLAVFAAMWAAFFFLHPEHLEKVGVGHYRIEIAPKQYHEIWFLDTFAILAANDAVTAGKDPYARNSLDFLHRPHVYGPAWLYLRHLGLTRADVRWVGASLALAVLALAVFHLRPRTAGEFVWSAAILCSTPVLSALERGNNDLVIFLLLAPAAPCLLSRHAALRWLAVVLVALAAELKIYPAVALVLLVASGGGTTERRWRVGVGAVLLALVGWHLVANSAPLRVVLPPLTGALTFGFEGVLREVGLTGPALLALSALAGLALFLFGLKSPLLRYWKVAGELQSAWLYFILGAVLLVGCYFAGQHFAYRWVFTVWLAPFLWATMTRADVPPRVRRLARLTGILVIATLWIEMIAIWLTHRLPNPEMVRILRTVWLGVQPITWALAFCLTLFLAHFVRENVRELLSGSRFFEQKVTKETKSQK